MTSYEKAFRITCALWGNPPVTGGFPSQRTSKAGFYVSFGVSLTNFWTNRHTAGELRRNGLMWCHRDGKKNWLMPSSWRNRHSTAGDKWTPLLTYFEQRIIDIQHVINVTMDQYTSIFTHNTEITRRTNIKHWAMGVNCGYFEFPAVWRYRTVSRKSNIARISDVSLDWE